MSKVALVTGGSRGIGASTCLLLADKGYAVAVNYRADNTAADAVVEQITAKGGRAIALQGDVGDEAQVIAMFEAVDKEFGQLDALVNNAGVSGPRGRLDELDLESIQRVLATNVTGAILCAREAVKRMSTRHGGKGGAIVNISSGSAYIGGPGSGIIYAVSKGALNSMQIGLSQEVAGEGIRVNAVLPGLTETDMPTRESLDRGGDVIPMGRVGLPEEIAEAVVWLLSDQASYVAGGMLRVAGGRP
ncbi:MAG: SDR family oxidoreductase [Rhodospirillaceae bacterium]|jgi:NAD(P)-dependent dehydrogenase (short-subunit alcohol dehydrogenase family)|nr:SDR family oxidoreductase [Rhodospirillaceae bacterium]